MKHEGVILAVDGASARVAVIPPQYASCKADPAEVPSRAMTAEAAAEIEGRLAVGARVVVATTARSLAVALTRVLVIPGAVAALAYLGGGAVAALVAGLATLGFVVSRGIAAGDRPRIVEVIDDGVDSRADPAETTPLT